MSEEPDLLKKSQPLVVGISLLSGALGLLPLPLLPEAAIAALRFVMLNWLARLRHVELPFAAARALAHLDLSRSGSLSTSTATAAALRSWRSIGGALVVLLRVEQAGRTFLLGTYFDRYLLAHHRGGALSPEQAEVVRRAVDRAATDAPMAILSALLGQVLEDLVRAGTYIPSALYNAIVSLLRRGEDEAERVEDLELSGILAGAIRAVERELEQTGRAALSALFESFDRSFEEVASMGEQPGASS